VVSDRAGCAATRKSTPGFVIKFIGSTIHVRSRTHATLALSSAEAELYAINTGATESLHIRNILQEALNIKKVNIRIHTDSLSGKSNKDWILKESKAHRAQTPFHPTIGAARSCEDHQDQHSEQDRGHLTKYVATETLLRHLNDAGLRTQHY
jgi:hypothetical protein